MRIHHDGKVGVGTGSTALTELLEVNGNAKATKFIGALEGNADSADEAATLTTTRAITIGPAAATLARDDAGNIAQLSNNFDGSAAISFDSKLALIHPMSTAGVSEGTDLRGADNSNESDETSNTAVKLIGSSSKIPVLKINRQGLVVGFDEVTGSGGVGGAFSGFDVTLHDELYFDSNYSDQAKKTISASPVNEFNIYFKSSDLFSAASISFDSGGTYESKLSLTIGGTTKTVDMDYDGLFTGFAMGTGSEANRLTATIGNTAKFIDLPDASFTKFELSTNTLTCKIGTTERDVDLSTIVPTAATNTSNIAINTTSTSSTRYITFTTNTSGNRAIYTDTGLTFQPSTNTLTASTFSGALSGNSTTSSGLLVGSTTYLGSVATANNTIVLRDAQGDINARYLQGTYVNTSDNIPSSNITYIMAKFGDNYHRSATAAKVRAFLGGLANISPVGNPSYYNIRVANANNADTVAYATSAGTAGTATTANNVKLHSASGNSSYRLIFTSAANGASTSTALYRDSEAGLYYNAFTNTLTATGGFAGGAASKANKVRLGSSGSTYYHAATSDTASTVVARNSSSAISVKNITAENISADSITLDDSANSIRAQHIAPNTTTYLNWGEHGDSPDGWGEEYKNYWIGQNSKIGYPGNNSSEQGSPPAGNTGAFKYGYFGGVFSYDAFFMGSDERLKKNIEDLSLGLDFVRLLQPKKFDWKKSETPRKKFGAIAQDVQAIISELSDDEDSLVSVIDYHENTEEENGQKLKFLDSTQIMWVLFNAVKQLDAKVQELEEKLEEK